MRLTTITRLAACLLAVASQATDAIALAQVPPDPLAERPAAPGAAAAPGQFPAPYVTRQAEMEVPFTVRAGSTPQTQPTAVRIFVSWDRGKTWHFYDERRPEEGRFRFRPRQDGEFWFATQTIDRSGRPDTAAHTPQRRLVLDTQRPQLLVQATVDASSNVVMSWNAVDTNLAPTSLKIEYQDAQGDGGAWQPVQVVASPGKFPAQVSGQTVFHPNVTSRSINLRAEVADAAGNIAYFSQKLSLNPPKPKIENGLAYAPAPDPSATRWPAGEGSGFGGQGSGGGVDRTNGGGQLAADLSPATPARERRPQPPAVVDNPFFTPGRLASSKSDAATESLPLPLPAAEPPRNAWRPSSPEPPEQPGDITPILPSPAPSIPAPVPSPAPEIMPEIVRPSQPAESLEPTNPQRPRLTNSRRFSLEYDLQTVGPEGVEAIELWGTTDGGRNWAKWGADPDKISPFDVEVGNESLYGFRIVVVGKNGLATHAPQANEPADIWVAVDLTQPKARLTGAAYGQGEAAGKLDIRWEASDDTLGSRPITLSIGERPDGPFTTIAAGLPNTGQYFWEFDPRSPRLIYLRLEARDDAGNIGIDQLSQPIKVEGLEPKGRIRGVNPAPEVQRGATRPPLLRQ
jgi:hypothetical protein